MRRSSQAGFTLIEIIIALGILVLVFSVTYSALDGITQTRELLDDNRDADALANAVLTRLTRELQLAYSGAPLLPEPDNPDAKYATNMNMIGSDQKIDGTYDADQITFMARSAAQYVPGGGGTGSGIVKITYRVEQDPEQRNEEEPTFVLVRQETPAIKPIERAFKRTMIFPVTNRLLSLNFRYYRDDDTEQEWHNDWGEHELVGLPTMVEFTVRIKSPRGQIRTMTTAVPLHPDTG